MLELKSIFLKCSASNFFLTSSLGFSLSACPKNPCINIILSLRVNFLDISKKVSLNLVLLHKVIISGILILQLPQHNSFSKPHPSGQLKTYYTLQTNYSIKWAPHHAKQMDSHI